MCLYYHAAYAYGTPTQRVNYRQVENVVISYAAYSKCLNGQVATVIQGRLQRYFRAWQQNERKLFEFWMGMWELVWSDM